MNSSANAFGARDRLQTRSGPKIIYRLDRVAAALNRPIERMPYCIRVLLENVLRNCDGFAVTTDHVESVAGWQPQRAAPTEIPFKPARVILQDFTGVPAIVDLAAMRAAMARLGGDPSRINPIVPVDLVIDHSVQVDYFGTTDALELNTKVEFERNRERYEFLRWGQNAFQNLRIVPPATGIVHQVNLEYLAKAVFTQKVGDETVAFPDTLVGTDSHTTMINGLGVVGWGVGGIEAEAVMLGQPIYMLIPDVVGFKLTGKLPEGATATDLVLIVTQMLRARGVVGKFVEFYGPGLSQMSLPDRATLANMAPEYGATIGFFPIDHESLQYLRRTGRSEEIVDLVDRYAKEQGLFRTDASVDPEYSDSICLDLTTVIPCLAGPKRPQDQVALSAMKSAFRSALLAPIEKRGFGLSDESTSRTAKITFNGDSAALTHGSVVIAAITSCTNTSNPSVLLGAGLLAKKAVERGLKPKPWVKTSLAPGSRVVTSYLEHSGLGGYLDELGFHTVGYGCTTCIGNSGPLPDAVGKAINDNNLVAAAVLSGNRNFEGRVHPMVKANYLASPPLVVAYALAGTVDIDMIDEPIGIGSDGTGVFLKDIWPTNREIEQAINSHVSPELFRERYANVLAGSPEWNAIESGAGRLYDWNESSTYIQEPPFFRNLSREPASPRDICKARVLVKFGDSVTTDHISPAGSIKPDSPAGKFLVAAGVTPSEFNSYGARRGNDRIMTRGTFANIRIRNQLAPGTEGGVTLHLPTGRLLAIYDAACEYQSAGTPLIVLAGAEYGSGSSRDWAAKGAALLGVKAVVAASYERIHRSNLVGMGVLPLQFQNGQSHESLGLTGRETYDIVGVARGLKPLCDLQVHATDEDGHVTSFTVTCRIDTPVEVEYFRNGGILQTVLRSFLSNA